MAFHDQAALDDSTSSLLRIMFPLNNLNRGSVKWSGNKAGNNAVFDCIRQARIQGWPRGHVPPLDL